MTERTLLIRFLFAFFAFLALSQCSSTDQEQEANRLFVESYRFAEQAREKEQTDPIASYEYYRQALENIDEIIDEYPETGVAVNVTQQQTRIGDMTVGELRRKVPLVESRARAMDGFHELTMYLVGRSNDEALSAEKQIRYADRIIQTGNEGRYRNILEQVSEWAHRHWNTTITDPVYLQLSKSYSNAGFWTEALDAADRLQNRDMLYQAIRHMLDDGILNDSENSVQERIFSYFQYVSSVQQLQLLRIAAADLFTLDRQEEADALIDRGLPSAEQEAILEHIDALTRLSAEYASHGSFSRSRIIIEDIEEMDENYADFARRDLSMHLARRHHVDEALEIASNFSRDYFRDTSVARIAVQVARNGRISDALELLDDVADDVTDKVDSYIEIAYLLSDYGENERSDALLELSRPLIEQIDSPLRRSELWLRIADCYMARNARSYAAETLGEAEADVLMINSGEGLNHMIVQTLSKWIKLGRPDRALDMAEHFRMNHDGFEENMKRVLDLAVNAGFHDLARSLAGITPDVHYFLHLLNQYYLDQNDIDRAIELSYGIRSFEWRARSQSDLVMALQKAGRETEKDKAASDALQTVDRIRDRDKKAETLLYVASRLSAAGQTMSRELKSIISDILSQFEL